MKRIVKLHPQTICNMLCEKKTKTNFWIMEFSCHWPLAPAVQESKGSGNLYFLLSDSRSLPQD